MVLSLAESGADSSGRLLAGVDKDISEDANTRKIAEGGEGVFFFYDPERAVFQSVWGIGRGKVEERERGKD